MRDSRFCCCDNFCIFVEAYSTAKSVVVTRHHRSAHIMFSFAKTLWPPPAYPPVVVLLTVVDMDPIDLA